MAYALIESGSFGTQPDNMKVMNGEINRVTSIRDTTGAGDALSTTFDYGRPTWQVSFNGVYATAAGGATHPMPVIGSAITGETFCISRVILVKRQQVKNTTCASDAFAASVFTPGKETFIGSAFGWLNDNDTVISDTSTDYPEGAAGSDTLTLPIYATGPVQITGSYRITNYRVGMPFSDGGAIPVTASFVYTGAVTDTNGPTNVSTYSNLAFNLDTGVAWSNVDIVPTSIRLDIDYENAVPTLVSVSGPISGAFTIT